MNDMTKRMICISNKSFCSGCQSCSQSCPQDAIIMKADEEGFLYPSVNFENCINCGICTSVCPEISPINTDCEITKVYACYRKDLDKRLKSQSGGVFALLAERIIENKGVVFGAAFDDNWKLTHRSAENLTELSDILGSKYIQSDIGVSFALAKKYLNKGLYVLFSGTPCQIQGLKKYLKGDYDNLITVDLICHGVSSPEVWKRYLNELKGDDNLIKFLQKDKTRDDSIVYTFEKRGEEVYLYEKNAFSRGYIENFYLRPSCYECTFKGINRCSDITLGDFWGLEQFHPEFGDRYGISASIIHTEKGSALFDKIICDLKSIECEPNMLLPQNPCVISSVACPESRKTFFKLWKRRGVTSTVNKLTDVSYLRRISRIKRVKSMIKTFVKSIPGNNKSKA